MVEFVYSSEINDRSRKYCSIWILPSFDLGQWSAQGEKADAKYSWASWSSKCFMPTRCKGSGVFHMISLKEKNGNFQWGYTVSQKLQWWTTIPFTAKCYDLISYLSSCLRNQWSFWTRFPHHFMTKDYLSPCWNDPASLCRPFHSNQCWESVIALPETLDSYGYLLTFLELFSKAPGMLNYLRISSNEPLCGIEQFSTFSIPFQIGLEKPWFLRRIIKTTYTVMYERDCMLSVLLVPLLCFCTN